MSVLRNVHVNVKSDVICSRKTNVDVLNNTPGEEKCHSGYKFCYISSLNGKNGVINIYNIYLV